MMLVHFTVGGRGGKTTCFLISFMASISNLQTTSFVDFSYSLVLVKLMNNSPSLKRETNDCNDVPPSLV